MIFVSSMSPSVMAVVSSSELLVRIFVSSISSSVKTESLALFAKSVWSRLDP